MLTLRSWITFWVPVDIHKSMKMTPIKSTYKIAMEMKTNQLTVEDKHLYSNLDYYDLGWGMTVLLCNLCNCEFKYLQDGQIGNTYTICHQTLFCTDENTDKLYITCWYTDRMCPLVYSRDHGNCAPSPWHCLQCSLHTSIPIKCVCRYIPETMRTIHFSMRW